VKRRAQATAPGWRQAGAMAQASPPAGYLRPCSQALAQSVPAMAMGLLKHMWSTQVSSPHAQRCLLVPRMGKPAQRSVLIQAGWLC
jgi:hypothetical protein